MAVLHIMRKDLLLVVRDRRAIAILIAMPLLFIAILGLSTGQIFGTAGQYVVWLVVTNEDSGELSRELVDALESRPEFEVTSRTGVSSDRRRSDGDRIVNVRIGPEFQRRIDNLEIGDVVEFRLGQLAGGSRSLDIKVEVDNTTTLAVMDRIELRPSALVTEFAIDQIVFGEAMAVLVPHVARTDPFMANYLNNWRRGLETPTEDATVNPPSAVTPFDPDEAAYTILVPGYTVCFAFFLILYMSRSFLSERDLGTLIRLRAAPIHRSALLFGKTVPFLLVSLVQVLLMFGFGRLLFGMPWGPYPWMLLPVLVSTALAATGLGMLVGTTARNDAQATAYGTLLVITMAAISGCFMPRAWMPEYLQQISLATPHAWALIAYEQLLRSESPDLFLVWECCAILVGFAVVFTAVGGWRFRSLT